MLKENLSQQVRNLRRRRPCRMRLPSRVCQRTMEVALVEFAADAMPGLPHNPRVNEIPFDSQRKRLSTVHATPEGPVPYCKGAPEIVLARCTWAEMDSSVVELSADLAVTFRAAAEAMAEKGLRVLAFAWRKLPESFVLTSFSTRGVDNQGRRSR